MTKKRKFVLAFISLAVIGSVAFFPWISAWGLIFVSKVFSCNQTFLSAVESENIAATKELVEQGHDPNCVDYRPVIYLESAKSPLSIAAKKKNFELMAYLMKEGAEPEDVLLGHYSVPIESLPFLISRAQLTQDDLNTLLVSYAGRPDIAKILIEKGADINIRVASNGWLKKKSWVEKNTKTPLYQASSSTSPKSVKLLLNEGADPNLPGKGGNLPISAAAVNRNPEVIQALIEAGADINRKSECGFPPLIIAAANGFSDNIKTLLEAGVDPNTKDNRNRTNEACFNDQLMGQKRGVRLNKEEGNHRRYILKIKDENNVKKYLKQKSTAEMAALYANMGIDGPYDGTALMWAAYSCDPESVSLLLENSADIHARDAYDATALMWGYACDAKAYERVVPLLLKAGADPNAKDAGGKTAKEYMRNRDFRR